MVYSWPKNTVLNLLLHNKWCTVDQSTLCWTCCYITNSFSQKCHGTRKLTAVFITKHYWPLPWATWLQSVSSHHISLISFNIIPPYETYFFRVVPFQDFPQNPLSISHMPCPTKPPPFDHPNNFGEEENHEVYQEIISSLMLLFPL